MKTVPVRDLRNQYGRILEEVAGGETFTITSAGVPVATISPHVPARVPGPREGVPLADLLTLPPILTPEQAAELKADLAEADGEAEDPWERYDRLEADRDGAGEDR
ncbi:type II toxin-antitoxin system Phd/YefM family antitoxin [Kineococcus sp. LSe6-4]|uniref:Type II toxin-antitoxin system Phd/YefM family antitoxin n=1 Tax=Kineococcus halophytocola TaxID=3234027 RepID=A0ABV4H1E9_9ACTN